MSYLINPYIFDNLPVTDVYARYVADSFSGTTWGDISGNNRNATVSRGTVTKTTATGNGALSTFTVLQGGTADGILFPSDVLPATYTLFHITRYNGANTARIINGNTKNWLSGHWSSNAGMSYHEGWLTQYSNIGITNTQWIISTDQNNLYRANGAVNGTSGGTSSDRIGINPNGIIAELSDWQCAEVIVYNRTLSETEYVSVENYLSLKYGITLRTLGTTSNNPIQKGSDIAGLSGYPTGNYYIKPTGIANAQLLHVDNVNQNGGWVLVAKGRQDNTGNGWWNNNDYNISQLNSAQKDTNTVAKMNTTFINAMIGGSWNASMSFMVNRELGDSWKYVLPAARTFAWTDFGSNTANDSANPTTANFSRYSAHFWGGTNTHNVTGNGVRDYMPANDATRTFTWYWSGHGTYRGWSAGSTVTTPGFQNGTEGHAIQQVNIYIKY